MVLEMLSLCTHSMAQKTHQCSIINVMRIYLTQYIITVTKPRCFKELVLIIIQYGIFYPSYVTSKEFKILGTNIKIRHTYGCTILVQFFYITPLGKLLRSLRCPSRLSHQWWGEGGA